MLYKSTEDRLNPVAPADADESTLGGYAAVHGRAAAFTGCDGQPYTVAVESEPSDADPSSWVAYLVFLRWAGSGSAIMDHLESGDLAEAPTEADARARLAALPLARVRELLDEAVMRRSDP
jgi:hypothetical protein